MPLRTLSRRRVLVDTPELVDPIEETFAFLVANGYSYTAAARQAQPDSKAPHNVGSRLSKVPRIQDRIRELAAGGPTAIVKAVDIRTVDQRLESLSSRWRALHEIVDGRALEYEKQYPEVAGGQTGWICNREVDGKAVHAIDYQLLDKVRDIERLAHEWDRRSASLRALHLHQHQHQAASLKDIMAKQTDEQKAALMAAFPEVREALAITDDRSKADTTPPVVVIAPTKK